MAEAVVPPIEDAARYAVGPDSVIWEFAGDARVMAGSGTALMLQVMHPTVGAGVSEHSNFREDPWGRLLRTLDYTSLLVYGGPDAAARTAARVRAMHKQIKGTRPDGTSYHALEPEAYAWVHATLFDTIVKAHHRFGRRMERHEVAAMYGEWRRLGRLLGVRDRDLPETLSGFGDYFDEMVQTRLERTDAALDVLAAMAEPTSPPVPPVVERVWRLAKIPAGRVVALATIGLLPPVLRERLDARWTRGKALELRAVGAVSRSMTPVLPPQLRCMGPYYLRLRHEEIARGRFGGGTPRSATPAAA